MRQANAFASYDRLPILVVSACLFCGCTTPLFRAQSPDAEDVTEVAESDQGVRYVGDYAVPWKTNYLKVEGVGFVTQLGGTGSDPPPSGSRDQLIKEMQTHEVKRPARALASDDTAMVRVIGYIRPGAKKGDVFDIEVRIPPRSRTTSLRGGWLMPVRLREMQVLDQAVHSGHVLALAKGPILVDSLFQAADDEVLQTRGRVLSGGIVNTARQLSLVIREEHSSVRTSSLIGAAINGRFHYFDRGQKSGVANPTRDDLIELTVHSRYKNNIARFLRVTSNIAVREPASERIRRLAVLERMLLEPTSAETAALQLEAYGAEAASTLKGGLQSPDPEVRFYAAESLAYLDEISGVDVLFEAARDERAFRWRALTALSVLDQYTAQERLAELMNAASAETRYGAFRALWTRNRLDPLVRGELVGTFSYHVVNTKGDPLIHFSRTRRPEIVVFGHGLRINPPAFLYAGDQILIKGINAEQVKMSRFRPGDETEHVVCSTEVDEVIRTIVKLGGGYSEVLAALKAAKDKGDLACRVELDALPRPGRTYRRDELVASNEDPSEDGFHVANPVPDMFFDRLSRNREGRDTGRDGADYSARKETRTQEGFFGRMTSWLPD